MDEILKDRLEELADASKNVARIETMFIKGQVDSKVLDSARLKEDELRRAIASDFMWKIELKKRIELLKKFTQEIHTKELMIMTYEIQIENEKMGQNKAFNIFDEY